MVGTNSQMQNNFSFEEIILTEFAEADIFFPFNSWPRWAQQAFTKQHKNRDERYKLFVFFWKNGMEPGTAASWIMRYGNYDRNAYSSLYDAVRDCYTQEGRERLRRTKVIDLVSGRVE